MRDDSTADLLNAWRDAAAAAELAERLSIEAATAARGAALHAAASGEVAQLAAEVATAATRAAEIARVVAGPSGESPSTGSPRRRPKEQIGAVHGAIEAPPEAVA